MAVATVGTAPMSKALAVAGMVISAILVLLFGMNWFLEVPFGPGNIVGTMGFIIGAAILGYLSWTVFREQS